jgi:uncharacterized membrane protein YfcA
MLTGTTLSLLYRLDCVGRSLAIWLTVLSFIPASVVAARLCRGVRPGPFAMWLFSLLCSASLVMLASDDETKPAEDEDAETQPGMGAKAIGSLIMCVILTGICSIPVRVAFRRQPEIVDLPTAQIRER